MALYDTQIRNAKTGSKPYKLTDDKGLLLLATPTGVSGGGCVTGLGVRKRCCPSVLTLKLSQARP